MGSPFSAHSSFPALNKFGPRLPRVDVHPRQQPACTGGKERKRKTQMKGGSLWGGCDVGGGADFPSELISEPLSPVSALGRKRLNQAHESVSRGAESRLRRSPVACSIYRHLRKMSSVGTPGATAA